MFSSPTRKRSRDDDEAAFDLTLLPLGKRSRRVECPSRSSFPTSSRPMRPLWAGMSSAPRVDSAVDTSEDESIRSNTSEADSAADDSMDLDVADVGRLWTSLSSGNINTSSLTPTWPFTTASVPIQRTPRKSDSLLIRPVRPKPFPLQSPQQPGLSRSFSSCETAVPLGRFTSPIDDEDEPHTPTAVTGSQLSMLSVNDMEIDSPHSTPARPSDLDPSIALVRRQRQRSGAFISSPDVAKRFQMGYKDDCEKCRNRVPGHMNHFVGSVSN